MEGCLSGFAVAGNFLPDLALLYGTRPDLDPGLGESVKIVREILPLWDFL
jgi:hypothetical protein